MRLWPRSVLAAALVSTSVFGLATTAWGEDGAGADRRPSATQAPPGPSPAPDVKDLDDRVRKLESAAENDVARFSWTDGLRLRSADGDFEAHVGGVLITHYRVIIDRPAFDGANARTIPNTFFIRTARIDLDGTLYRQFEYKLQANFPSSFAATTTGALQDGYLGWMRYPELSLRVGQFRVPFSQEELESVRFINFSERCVLNRLVPSRDLGAMLFGDLAGRLLQYEVSAYNGNGRVTDNNDHTDTAVRLRVTPFISSDLKAVKQLRLGVAQTWGQAESAACGAGTSDGLDFSTTELGVVFLNSTAGAIDGVRTRTGVEMSWLCGPGSLRAEWMRRRDPVRVGADRVRIGEDAWYVAGTCLLTGEDKKLETRVVPDDPLDPDRGGWGAVELAARVAALSVDHAVFSSGIAPADGNANGVTTFTLGFNWWLTRNVRFSPDVVYERFNRAVDFGDGVRLRRAMGPLIRFQADF